ncbi:MAG: glycosyltransferase [bacterium]
MASAAPRVSIVIVHHNTPDLLDACLASIARTPLGAPYEIIVLDNASNPPLPAGFEVAWPAVRLVRNLENIGYARAVNQGVRAAAAEYVLILNPDIEVIGDAIGEMVRFLDAHPDAGIAGCRLLNPDGTLQYSCRAFYDWKTLVYRRTPLGRIFPNSAVVRRHLMADWDHATVREVDWLIGACLLARREAIDRVGLMDERFFMYFEDVDWCYRMSKAGYKVFYLPSAEMKHHHRRQSARPLDRRFVVHLLSMLRYADKWNPLLWRARRRREVFATITTLVADLAAANAAFLAAFLLRNALSSYFVKPVFGLAPYVPFILFMNAILAVTFWVMGAYKSRVRALGGEALGPILRASFVAYLILTLTTFLSREILYSRLVILAFLPLATLLVLLFRELLRRAQRLLRRNAFDLRRALIVGSGATAARARASLESDPDLRYEIAGVVGDGPGSVGRFEDLPRLIESHRVHDVVLADNELDRGRVEEFLLSFPRLPVEVIVVVNESTPTTRHAHPDELGEVPVLVFEPGTRFGIRAAEKRVLDFLIGGAFGALLFPVLVLLLLTRVALRGGPLESRSYRAFGGGDLVLYSVRGPAASEPRSWSLLPRLYSVVTGKLSLVGVPPERLSAAGESVRDLPAGMIPFWLWARSAPPADRHDWERLARGYRLRWSASLDLSIILRSLLRG